MKIYKISQYVNKEYDSYDSAIVCCESEKEAIEMHPADGLPLSDKNYRCRSWVKTSELVEVEYIGEAKDGMKQEVICASFNAG